MAPVVGKKYVDIKIFITSAQFNRKLTRFHVSFTLHLSFTACYKKLPLIVTANPAN